MFKSIIEFIQDQRTLDSHYLPKVAKEMGLEYDTLYNVVMGRRTGSAETAEKMIIWWLKQKGVKV